MPTITIKKEVSWIEISYILSSAIDSGLCLWLLDYDAECTQGKVDGDSSNCNYLGIILRNSKGGGEYDEPVAKNAIVLQDICDALEKINSDPKSVGLMYNYSFNFDNYDGFDADIVLQVAFFGKVIYG